MSRASMPVFREEDYASLEHVVFAFNATTETELKPSEKVEVIEFLEKAVVINVPDRFCQLGHHVVLYLVPKDGSQRAASFSEAKARQEGLGVTGKVVSYEKLPQSDENRCAAKVEFFQFNEKEWDLIRKTYRDRQVAVDQIMKKVRT